LLYKGADAVTDRQTRSRVTHDPRSPTKVEPRTKPKNRGKKEEEEERKREREGKKKKTEEKKRRKKHNLEIHPPPPPLPPSAHHRSTLFLIDAFFLQLFFVPRPRLLHQGKQIKRGKTGDLLLTELASPRIHFFIISGTWKFALCS
jgi:hypothetical protein